jgi:hypothetical protein
MEEIEKLRQEVEKIKERNSRVEKEKAWETSAVRRLTIVVLTYFVMICALTVIHNDNPFINAVIPTTGYFLSTLSIGVVKRWWVAKKV